MPNLSGRQT